MKDENDTHLETISRLQCAAGGVRAKTLRPLACPHPPLAEWGTMFTRELCSRTFQPSRDPSTGWRCHSAGGAIHRRCHSVLGFLLG